MIIFKNKGCIDIRAIKTFGVSVKKEGSIGFFGTGLKYAIAILLREAHAITIWSGGERYEFTVRETEVTGEKFNIVCMNGEELGFTTELGKTWKMWQAFREIYCNCTDEGGQIYSAKDVDLSSIETDGTLIAVSGAEFEMMHENVGHFILQGPCDMENEFITLRHGATKRVYYKGVMVKDDANPCLYTYNIKNKIDLTEDRTAKYSFQVNEAITKGIVNLEDETILENILLAPEYSFERQLCYDTSVRPSDTFLKVCSRLATAQSRGLNRGAVKYAKKYMEIDTDPELMPLSTMQRNQLDRAIELLAKVGYQVDKYPILPVQTLGHNILGKAEDGKIFITEQCFQKGTKEIACTLFEEYVHLDRGLSDETREMQTYLFENILTLVERLNEEAF